MSWVGGREQSTAAGKVRCCSRFLFVSGQAAGPQPTSLAECGAASCTGDLHALLASPYPNSARALAHSQQPPTDAHLPLATALLCLCLAGEDEYHDAVEEFEANASGRHSIDSHVSSPRSGHSHDPDPAAQQQQQQEPPGLAARLSSWWEGLKAGPASSSGSLGGGGGGGFAASGHSAGDDATPRAPGSPHPPVRTHRGMIFALGKPARAQTVSKPPAIATTPKQNPPHTHLHLHTPTACRYPTPRCRACRLRGSWSLPRQRARAGA